MPQPGVDADEGAALATQVWRARIVHLASLLHASTVAFLRDDLDLRNLVPYCNRHLQPPAAAAADEEAAHGDVAALAAASQHAGDAPAAAPACCEAACNTAVAPAPALPKAGAPEWVALQEHDASKAFKNAHPLHNVFCYSWGQAVNRMCAAAVPLPVLGGVSDAERDALAATPERARLVLAWLHRAIAARVATRGGLVVGAAFCAWRGRGCGGLTSDATRAAGTQPCRLAMLDAATSHTSAA